MKMIGLKFFTAMVGITDHILQPMSIPDFWVELGGANVVIFNYEIMKL